MSRLMAQENAPAYALYAPGPGPDLPRIDDHLVVPETPQEMVRGRLLAMPCKEAHGDPHCQLDYLIRAHVRPGYVPSTDLLTRWSKDSDFASDTCIRQEGTDPRTGLRHLEQIVFEIVSAQTVADVTARAEDMAARGVRRIFALFVKTGQVTEWARRTRKWTPLDLDGEITDRRCLIKPIPARALLDAAVADNAVAAALIRKKNPVILAHGRKQRELGLKEGEARVLRETIEDLCDAYGLRLTAKRRATLASLDAAGLRGLRTHLKQHRRWPAGTPGPSRTGP